MQHAAWAPLAAFTASLVICWWLVRSRLARFALDRPNERSLHASPIPRTGGIAIQSGILISCPLIAAKLPSALWLGWAALIAISFYDDLKGLSPAIRLAIHLATALLASHAIALGQEPAWIILVAGFCIAWMANLYNFMDGADGLAGGMAVIGFLSYAVASWLVGDTTFAALNATVAAAAAAFLVFNLHPARIFMGDVGSVPLGFLAGAFGFAGWTWGHWEVWFPLLVFSPFVLDATATLVRRLTRRERVWVAHRDHYYQRLVRMGWGHHKTAMAEYVLMGACGIAALAATGRSPAFQAVVLTAAAIVYAVLAAAIDRYWHRAQARGAP